MEEPEQGKTQPQRVQIINTATFSDADGQINHLRVELATEIKPGEVIAFQLRADELGEVEIIETKPEVKKSRTGSPL
ncbi:MAG: hypothetical protein ACPL6F_03160, partial [Anaerolineales bacterium]